MNAGATAMSAASQNYAKLLDALRRAGVTFEPWAPANRAPRQIVMKGTWHTDGIVVNMDVVLGDDPLVWWGVARKFDPLSDVPLLLADMYRQLLVKILEQP